MRTFFKSESGGILIFAAFATMVLVAAVGVSIDISRQHAVKLRAQEAVDRALIGAVRSQHEMRVPPEFRRLLRANFQNGYMGDTRIVSIDVFAPTRNLDTGDVGSDVDSDKGGRGSSSSDADSERDPRDRLPDGVVYDGRFEANVVVETNNMVMQLFGYEKATIPIRAVAELNIEQQNIEVELAGAFDVTGSMAGQKLIDLKDASKLVVDILTGGDTIDNFHMSVIPWSTSVAIDTTEHPNALNWVQNAWLPRANIQSTVLGRVWLSNRNLDNLIETSTHSDITDDYPTTEALKFRTPTGYLNSAIPYNPLNPGPFVYCSDFRDLESLNNAPLIFAENDPALIKSHIDSLVVGGCTRSTTGMLWSWMALSSKWKGQWTASKPDYPSDNPHSIKIVLFMTDGQNTVYIGQSPNVTHDDTRTSEICTAMKAQGITIYSVTLGGSVNAAMVSACASPGKYYHAPTSSDLGDVFQQIAENIRSEFLLLLE